MKFFLYNFSVLLVSTSFVAVQASLGSVCAMEGVTVGSCDNSVGDLIKCCPVNGQNYSICTLASGACPTKFIPEGSKCNAINPGTAACTYDRYIAVRRFTNHIILFRLAWNELLW
ncbi:hypothetical protein BJ165DRAFT_1608403 [Panaeolus papilionaceus]|nr:hypothetical protein BJ165DRAFT_1608403 [Panaeolus papilionaceus]